MPGLPNSTPGQSQADAHFVTFYAWLPSLIRISVTTQSLTEDAIILQFMAHLYVK
jgi:hypothetical protein